MNIKKITKKLSKARDEITEKEEISYEIKQALEGMVKAQNDNKSPINFEPKTLSGRILTDDQRHRLRLIEKTGTGSNAIH